MDSYKKYSDENESRHDNSRETSKRENIKVKKDGGSEQQQRAREEQGGKTV